MQRPAPQNRFAVPHRGIGWWPAVFMLLIVAIAVAVGIFLTRTHNIPTDQVKRGRVVRAFYATGTVRPEKEYLIKSKAQGAVTKFTLREGDYISEGQPIAVVDDRQLKFEVDRMAAELSEARKKAQDDAPDRTEIEARRNEAKQQLEIAEREATRLTTMFDKGVASMPDLDAARTNHVKWANMVAAYDSQLQNWRIQSQKNVDVAGANLAKAKANLEDTIIKSPTAGTLLERYIEDGEVVSPNQKIILVARSDPQTLIMKAAVDEEDVTRTHFGGRVWMQLYAYKDDQGNERVMEGKVDKVFPIADPTNKTYEVWVRFNEPPPDLKVGMTAELNFEEHVSENALVVPTTAIMEGKVYRKNAEGKYDPVDVKLGIRNIEQAEIIAGLNEGDIIAHDAKQLAPIKLPASKTPVVPTRTGDKKEVAQRSED